MTGFRKVAFGLFALAITTGIVSPGSAFADLMVSYSTSGTFNVDSTSGPTITLKNGNLTIDVTYTGTSQTNLAIPDATAPFGVFTVTADTDGSANLPTSGNFSLLLTQTSPSANSGTFTSLVSGSIQLGSSNDLTITFNSPPNPITFGTITYTLPSSVSLPSPPKEAGKFTTTNLTANISTTDSLVPLPEPSTLISAAIGAVMFLGYSSRRRAKAKV